jgi:hypothetical protein
MRKNTSCDTVPGNSCSGVGERCEEDEEKDAKTCIATRVSLRFASM